MRSSLGHLGRWTITIHGYGMTRSLDYPKLDIECLYKEFVRNLSRAGHHIETHNLEVTVDGQDEQA